MSSRCHRDTGSFGSLQALPAFLQRFGEVNAKGTYVLPAARKSMMNSLPWIGKIIGCFGAEHIIQKLGYRKTMYIAAAIQIVAIISKCAAINLKFLIETIADALFDALPS